MSALPSQLPRAATRHALGAARPARRSVRHCDQLARHFRAGIARDGDVIVEEQLGRHDRDVP